MKTDVFWSLPPCSLIELTDVSKVLTASIVRAQLLLEFEGPNFTPTQKQKVKL
jgi:hypothetical protein